MESSETWSFFYDSLDRGRNEIRLVHIHPAPDREAEISCSLSHVSLDVQPAYMALSYCWGSPQKSRSIHIDEQEFPVTENLYEALREVRSPTQPVAIWIDQISINQEDVAERNQEVLRMLDIYRGAAHVIVWLGPASDHTADAIEYLKKLSFYEKIDSTNTKRSGADIVLI